MITAICPPALGPPSREACRTNQWPEAVRRRTFGSRSGCTSLSRSRACKRAAASTAYGNACCVRGQSAAATSASHLSAVGVMAASERSSASSSTPGSSGSAGLVVALISSALRKPSARCGVSRARKAASPAVKGGLDRSRCKHMNPQQAPPVISAARSSSPKPSGVRISRERGLRSRSCLVA